MTIDTRPHGLYTPAQPVTVRDPYSPQAQAEEARQMAARRAELRAAVVEYVPAMTAAEIAELRQQLDERRKALNRAARA